MDSRLKIKAQKIAADYGISGDDVYNKIVSIYRGEDKGDKFFGKLSKDYGVPADRFRNAFKKDYDAEFPAIPETPPQPAPTMTQPEYDQFVPYKEQEQPQQVTPEAPVETTPEAQRTVAVHKAIGLDEATNEKRLIEQQRKAREEQAKKPMFSTEPTVQVDRAAPAASTTAVAPTPIKETDTRKYAFDKMGLREVATDGKETAIKTPPTIEEVAQQKPQQELRQREYSGTVEEIKDRIKQSMEAGSTDAYKSQVLGTMLSNGATYEEMAKAKKDLDRQLPTPEALKTDDNLLEKAIYGAAQIIPAMVESVKEGQEGAIAGAVAGGMAGLAGGVTALPTAIAGAGIGQAAASTDYWRRQGLADTYFYLKDEIGASDETARTAANIAAVPYALIDRLQVSKAMRLVPKPVRNAILAKGAAALKRVLVGSVKDVAEETLLEGAQKGIQTVAGEVTKYIEGDQELNKSNIGKSILQTVKDAAIESKEAAPAMTAIMLPSIFGRGRVARQGMKQAQAVEAEVERFNNKYKDIGLEIEVVDGRPTIKGVTPPKLKTISEEGEVTTAPLSPEEIQSFKSIEQSIKDGEGTPLEVTTPDPTIAPAPEEAQSGAIEAQAEASPVQAVAPFSARTVAETIYEAVAKGEKNYGKYLNQLTDQQRKEVGKEIEKVKIEKKEEAVKAEKEAKERAKLEAEIESPTPELALIDNKPIATWVRENLKPDGSISVKDKGLTTDQLKQVAKEVKVLKTQPQVKAEIDKELEAQAKSLQVPEPPVEAEEGTVKPLKAQTKKEAAPVQKPKTEAAPPPVATTTPLKLYRGTKEDGEGKFGGEYFSTDKTVADEYAGKDGKIETVEVGATAKMLDLSDPDMLFDYMVDKGMVEKDNVDAENYIKSGQLYQYDGSGNTENKLIAAAINDGYSILKFPDNLGSTTDNNAYVVLDRKAVKETKTVEQEVQVTPEATTEETTEQAEQPKEEVREATKNGVKVRQIIKANGNIRNEILFPDGGFVEQEKDSNGEEVDLLIKPSKGGDYRNFVTVLPDRSMEINEKAVEKFIIDGLSKKQIKQADVPRVQTVTEPVKESTPALTKQAQTQAESKIKPVMAEETTQKDVPVKTPIKKSIEDISGADIDIDLTPEEMTLKEIEENLTPEEKAVLEGEPTPEEIDAMSIPDSKATPENPVAVETETAAGTLEVVTDRPRTVDNVRRRTSKANKEGRTKKAAMTQKAIEKKYMPEDKNKQIEAFDDTLTDQEIEEVNKISRAVITAESYANKTGETLPATELAKIVRDFRNNPLSKRVEDKLTKLAAKKIENYLRSMGFNSNTGEAVTKKDQRGEVIAIDPNVAAHNRRAINPMEVLTEIEENLPIPELINKSVKNYELTDQIGDRVREEDISAVTGLIAERYFGGNIPNKVSVIISNTDLTGKPLNQRAAQIKIQGEDVQIVINQRLARKDVPVTLIHELVGHLGLGGILKTEKGTYDSLYKLYEKEKRNYEMANKVMTADDKRFQDRFGVFIDLEGSSDNVLFSEWLADATERYDKAGAPPVYRSVLGQLRAFFTRLYQRIFGQRPSMEIDQLIAESIEKLRNSGATEADAMMSKGERNVPIFYSALSRAFESAKQTSMPAQQWSQWLDSNAPKMGVKKDEIEWSGIKDFLNLKGKEKVSKDDIVNYLDQNGVKIKEIKKGSVDLGAPAPVMNMGEWLEKYHNIKQGDTETLLNLSFDEKKKLMDEYDRYGEKERFRFENERRALEKQKKTISTKFETYQLPGGKNYKELLLTLPMKKERLVIPKIIKGQKPTERAALKNQPYTAFKSSHFDEPNILAHVRMNERTDTDGNKVLFIEEIQSDWAQAGRKKGFREEVVQAEGDNIINDYINETERLEQLGRPPLAPFVTDTKSWTALALKRILRYAVDNGFDKIAWTTGEQQADRYDLAKQIDKVFAIKKDDNTYDLRIEKDGREVLTDNYKAEDLEDIVGKELAKKIVTGENAVEQTSYVAKANGEISIAKYSGLDLKVGGEGMTAFYDNIVPQVANDILKKVGGGRVEQIDIDGLGKQQGVVITPAMTDKISEGLSLFKGATSQDNDTDLPLNKQADKVVEDFSSDIDRIAELLQGDDVTALLDDLTYRIADIEETQTFRAGLKKRLYDLGDLLQHRIGIIKRIQNGMEKKQKGTITEANNAWSILKRLGSLVSDQTLRFKNNYQLPLTNIMSANKISQEEIGEYRIALHTPEANNALWRRDAAKKVDAEIEQQKRVAQLKNEPFTYPTPEERKTRIDFEQAQQAIRNKKPSGMTDAEAEAVVAKYEKDNRAPAFKAANKILSDINEFKLNLYVESGILSEEVANLWRELYPTHIGLRGVDADAIADLAIAKGLSAEQVTTLTNEAVEFNESVIEGTGRQGKSGQKILVKRKKREATADAVLSLLGVIESAEVAIVKANENKAARTVLELVKASPGSSEFWKLLTKKEYDNLKGRAPEDFGRAMGKREIKDTVYKGWENGKQFYIQIKDPRLDKALNTGGRLALAQLPGLKQLAAVTRYQSAMFTARNPLFLFTNIARDIQQAALVAYSQQGFAGAGNVLLNWAKIFPEVALPKIGKALKNYEAGKKPVTETEKYLDEFMSAGAAVTRVEKPTMKTIAQEMEDAGIAEYVSDWENNPSTPKKAGKAVFNSLRFILDQIENANNRFETMTRLAFYISERKRGASKAEAAVGARDVTVDFAQKGAIGETLNIAFAFANAGLVGSGVVLRALNTPRGRAAAMALVGLGILQAWQADDDDTEDENGLTEWDRLSPYKKSTRWSFGGGKGGFAHIPMPYGFNVFPALGAALYDLKKGRHNGFEVIAGTVSNIVNAYSPIRPEQSLVSSITPTVAKPLVEVWENTDFMGGSIHPTYKQPGAYPELTKGKHTKPVFAGLAKLWLGLKPDAIRNTYLGEKLAFYPDDIEHIMFSYLGGYGQITENLLKLGSAKAKGLKFEKKDIPLFNRFYSEPDAINKYKRYFYDSSEYVQALIRETREGDIPKDVNAAIGELEWVMKDIRRANKEKTELYKEGDFLGAQKHDIDIIRPLMMDYYKVGTKTSAIIKKYIGDTGKNIQGVLPTY